MEDQKELVLQIKYDAFSKSAKSEDLLPFRFSNRRIEGAHDKRARDPNLKNGLIENALLKRVDVNSNVRQFRHLSYWLTCEESMDKHARTSFTARERKVTREQKDFSRSLP